MGNRSVIEAKLSSVLDKMTLNIIKTQNEDQKQVDADNEWCLHQRVSSETGPENGAELPPPCTEDMLIAAAVLDKNL